MVGVLPFQDHFVYPIRLRKKFIVRELVLDIKYNQETCRNAHGKTNDIDTGINPLFDQASEGRFNVIS